MYDVVVARDIVVKIVLLVFELASVAAVVLAVAGYVPELPRFYKPGEKVHGDRHASGLAGCGRCGKEWNGNWHSTPYGAGAGVFPLCQMCWVALSPMERLPYYEALMGTWAEEGYPPSQADRIAIREAVMAGL